MEELDSWIKSDIEYGNLDIDSEDDRERYAHETADGCSYVIYFGKALALWIDDMAVSDFEGEALEMLAFEPSTISIGQIASACAYLAIRAALLSAMDELREEVTV